MPSGDSLAAGTPRRKGMGAEMLDEFGTASLPWAQCVFLEKMEKNKGENCELKTRINLDMMNLAASLAVICHVVWVT